MFDAFIIAPPFFFIIIIIMKALFEGTHFFFTGFDPKKDPVAKCSTWSTFPA